MCYLPLTFHSFISGTVDRQMILVLPLLLLTAELPAYMTNPYKPFSARPCTLPCITNARSLSPSMAAFGFKICFNSINHCHYRSKKLRNKNISPYVYFFLILFTSKPPQLLSSGQKKQKISTSYY